MTAEHLILKGLISDMPEGTQKAIANAKEALKQLVEQHGEAGILALALLSCELGEAD